MSPANGIDRPVTNASKGAKPLLFGNANRVTQQFLGASCHLKGDLCGHPEPPQPGAG
jgi:hypothetical protein